MKKELIKVGERYATRNGGNFFGEIVMELTKVENSTSQDGYGYFTTKELMHRRKHHKARAWWFKEQCRLIRN